MSMVEQITVLLALTAGLFDRVPLKKAMEAEKALHKAAAENSGGPCESIDSSRQIKRRRPQVDSGYRYPDARSLVPAPSRTKPDRLEPNHERQH